MGTMWRTAPMAFSPSYHMGGSFSNWPKSWQLFSHSGRTTGRTPWTGAPVLLASSDSPNGVTLMRSPGTEPPVGQAWPGFDVTFPGDIKDFVPEIFGGALPSDPYAWRGVCRLVVQPFNAGIASTYTAHSESPSPGMYFGQVQHNVKPSLYNENYSYRPVEIKVTESYAFDSANMKEIRISFGDGDEEQILIPTFVRADYTFGIINIGTTWSGVSALYDYHKNANYITRVVMIDGIGRETEFRGNFNITTCELIPRKACGCDSLTGQMFLYRDTADGVAPAIQQNIASVYEGEEGAEIGLQSRSTTNIARTTNVWRDERNDWYRTVGPGGLGGWRADASSTDGRNLSRSIALQWSDYTAPTSPSPLVKTWRYFTATSAMTFDGTICSAAVYGEGFGSIGSGAQNDWTHQLFFGTCRFFPSVTTPSEYGATVKVTDLDNTSRWVRDPWAIQVLDTGRVVVTDCRTRLFYSDDLGRSWGGAEWRCWPDDSEESIWIYTSGRLVEPGVFVTVAVLATGEFPNYNFSMWARTGKITNEHTLNMMWSDPVKLADLERQEPWVIVDLSLSGSGSVFATNCYDRFYRTENLGKSWEAIGDNG